LTKRKKKKKKEKEKEKEKKNCFLDCAVKKLKKKDKR